MTDEDEAHSLSGHGMLPSRTAVATTTSDNAAASTIHFSQPSGAPQLNIYSITTQTGSSDILPTDQPAPESKPSPSAQPAQPLTETTAPPDVLSKSEPVDPAMSKVIDNVLHSDIGTNILLGRLKQSVVSAKDVAGFFKKRSQLEEHHAKELKALKQNFGGVRSKELRQDSFATQYEDIIHIHDRMAENAISFSLELHRMATDLENLSNDMDRERKKWKQTTHAAESRLQDAEKALDKAKLKYESLAETYDQARTGDRVNIRTFTIRQRSASQQEEELFRRAGLADSDYQNRVQQAQAVRDEIERISRPQAIQVLLRLIRECDAGLTLHLQKFAVLSEKLVLGNGVLVSPLSEGADSQKGMRFSAAQINNDKDFNLYVTAYLGEVPLRKEIKYEKHPALSGAPPSKSPYRAETLNNKSSFTPVSPTQPHTFPQTSSLPLYDSLHQQSHMNQPLQSQSTAQQVAPYSSGPINNGPYLPHTDAHPPEYYNQQQNYPQQRTSHNGPSSLASPVYTGQPSSSKPLPPMDEFTYAPQQPTGYPTVIFGLSLDAVFEKYGVAVPAVVEKCIEAVDLFGHESNEIYLRSGNPSLVRNLREFFDKDFTQIDLTAKPNFFNDVNIPATLLIQYLRELPEPLLTREQYHDFLTAAHTTDDTLRRDHLHARINNLPDPNYATLRAVALHLQRVVKRSNSNRISIDSLSTIFAPSFMGSESGKSVEDAALEHKVVATILTCALQIFDDD